MKKFCKKYAVMSFTTFVILCKKYWYLGNKVTAKLLFPKKNPNFIRTEDRHLIT